MDKYKSWIIPDKDISITTDRRWFNNIDSIFVVEIKHMPSGMIASSEDKSQIIAYNQAIKIIENSILKK